jgi:predicted O-methyltransferase YrrM
MFITIGEFLLKNDSSLIDNLKKLKHDNQVEKRIKELIETLDYNDVDNENNLYEYDPIIDETLKEDLKIIEGWFDFCEANLLYQLIAQVPKNQDNLIKVVEIGAFLGKSTIAIAKAIKENGGGFVHSIDPHEGIPYTHPQPTLPDFIENINRANINNIVNICLGMSSEWSDKISTGLSMIFIDGEHTYEMVKNDYLQWEKKIMINGLIAFHDAIQAGPFKLISELLNSQNYRLIFIVGSLAVIQKKRNKQQEIISVLNQILLNLYRLNYLEFLKSDYLSKREQIKELFKIILKKESTFSFYNMLMIIVVKLFLKIF